MEKLNRKLNNIKYPFNLSGSYKFKDKNEAYKFMVSSSELLNENGCFHSRYSNDDPNCQKLSAAINFYLFEIDNNDSKRINEIKKKYAYCQNSMYLNKFFGKIIKTNNILSLKELSKIIIRKSVANHLGLVRVDEPNNVIFRPLMNIKYRHVSWKLPLINNLKIVGKCLPKILSEYIEAPDLEISENYFLFKLSGINLRTE